MKITAEQLEDARLNLAHNTHKYLQERGWKYSCSYPDSCWRFSKETEDGVMTLNASAAFKMESDFLDIQD